jgi:hypothetical protein
MSSSRQSKRVTAREICLVDSAGTTQFTLKIEENLDQNHFRVPALVVTDKLGKVRVRLVAYDEGQERDRDPNTYLEVGSWSTIEPTFRGT